MLSDFIKMILKKGIFKLRKSESNLVSKFVDITLQRAYFFGLGHWFSTGGPQHVSRVGHGRLHTLKMGLHAE